MILLRVPPRRPGRDGAGAGVDADLEAALAAALPDTWRTERYLPPAKGRWTATAFPADRPFDYIAGFGVTEADAVRGLLVKLARIRRAEAKERR